MKKNYRVDHLIDAYIDDDLPHLEFIWGDMWITADGTRPRFEIWRYFPGQTDGESL